MTSLPIIWGEADDIGGMLSDDGGPAPIYKYLDEHYRITVIDDLEKLPVAKVDILLLAQPRGLAPVELDVFDKWVRDGGKAVILADPHLAWPSHFSIGDKRRPIFTSLLSPLFTHWGIELRLPENSNEKPEAIQLEGQEVVVHRSGRFALSRKVKSLCDLHAKKLIADCVVERGRAVIIADADFLDDRIFAADEENYVDLALHNFDFLNRQLVKLSGD